GFSAAPIAEVFIRGDLDAAAISVPRRAAVRNVVDRIDLVVVLGADFRARVRALDADELDASCFIESVLSGDGRVLQFRSCDEREPSIRPNGALRRRD